MLVLDVESSVKCGKYSEFENLARTKETTFVGKEGLLVNIVYLNKLINGKSKF